MVEPLSPAVPSALLDPTGPEIAVTYDATTGRVSLSPSSVTIAASTTILLTLTTTGSAQPARFYGFTISANWPFEIQLSFPSDQEIAAFVPVPDTPAGSYQLMPSIQATGASVANAAVLLLTVAA